MACHDDENVPVVGASLDDADTYKVSALVNQMNADGNPELKLNCEELRRAYDMSCAGSMASFDQFSSEVLASANEGAAPIFGPSMAINDQFADSAQAQRILTIRICVRWRFIRIYIILKI